MSIALSTLPVVEVFFSWPGLGTLTVDALDGRDYPVLQGIFVILSVSVVVANLIADLGFDSLMFVELQAAVEDAGGRIATVRA